MKSINLLQILLAFLSISCNHDPDVNGEFNFNIVYDHIEKILEERKSNLTRYLTSTKLSAKKIIDDPIMTSFFVAKRNFYALSKDTTLPKSICDEIESLKQKIEHHYLMNYITFYDILFVDTNGDIFYTIRKEKDYHQNIFDGALKATALSRILKENPTESYVDFNFYNISGKPSAFFIEPVRQEGKPLGWFVLQCAINNVNKLFEESSNLGRTGEVLLVNKEHYLLTNSRFDTHTTILNQKLPKNNIVSKFKERKGRKEVIDYRNEEVLSAFEVIEFLGTEWLIVVKKDKSEIISKFYLDNKKAPFFDNLWNDISPINSQATELPIKDEPIVNVEMDEFQRADTGQVLFTQGVSTCTAITFSYPGKFAYMAHISPFDKIYGETKTDILEHMLREASYFDITESGKQKVEICIFLTQTNSIERSIDILLNHGYFLSQIKILYEKNAEYGNLYHDTKSNQTFVDCQYNSTDSVKWFTFENQKNLQEVLLLKSEVDIKQ